jgi:tRNA threonylcarbamoyladenosine biosynthesis protein TsaE
MKTLSKSSEETVELGEKLAKSLKGGEVVALYGDLGGGKTQFTKGIARGLGVRDDIISPTFVIRRDYKGKKLGLLHYDFYRFDEPDEELVESLEEGINSKNVTVIEWAERVEKHLPKNAIKITFHYIGKDEREIESKGLLF